MILRIIWKLESDMKFAIFPHKLSLRFALRCELFSNVLLMSFISVRTSFKDSVFKKILNLLFAK